MSDDFEISPQATEERIKENRYRVLTDRGWEGYPHDFGLADKPVEYWQGKQILDVGSGTKIREPEPFFPGAKIHVVDPEIGGRIVFQSADEVRKGVVQEIPYDDDKFDLVFSLHAVPQHISRRDFPRAISEMIRVTKPDGEIRLTPCVEKYDVTAKIETALADAGFEVEFLKREGFPDVTIIRPVKELIKSKRDKRIGWEKLHRVFYPEEEIRPVV